MVLTDPGEQRKDLSTYNHEGTKSGSMGTLSEL